MYPYSYAYSYCNGNNHIFVFSGNITGFENQIPEGTLCACGLVRYHKEKPKCPHCGREIDSTSTVAETRYSVIDTVLDGAKSDKTRKR